MPVDRALLDRAYRNPQDLRFEEALTLAEQLGFECVRTAGSHHIFHHPKAQTIRARFPRPLNLQGARDGKAKAYQVKQLLQMAEALGIILAREDG
jgi:HicA toxin of bacterial toxin-antitoxin,